MKKINKLWLLAMPLAFAACQNETLEDVFQTSSKEFTLHCTVESAPVTRAQVEIGNEDRSRERFMWNDGDQISIFDMTDFTKGKTFTIAGSDFNNNPQASADFCGTESIADGTEIAAVYPVVGEDDFATGSVVYMNLADYENVQVDGSYTGPQSELWREVLRPRMFMYASGLVKNNSAELVFKQLTAMVRVTYINSTTEEQTIYSVALEGNGTYFGSYAKFNLATGVNSVASDRDHVAVNFSGGKKLQPGESCDVYMVFFPASSFNENTKFYVRGSGNLCTPALPGSTILAANEGAKGFEAGKRYWYTVAQTEDGLIWAKQGPKIENLDLIAAIESTGIEFTKTTDGKVDVNANRSLIEGTRKLVLTAKNLTDLSGIEYFTSLDTLHLASNKLTSVDVSMTHVRDLTVENNNQLTELVLNPEMGALNCSSTALKTLDLSGCPNLTSLSVWKNQLDTLDLSACTNLSYVNVEGGQLTEIILGEQPFLVTLKANNNKLETLDLTSCPSLQVANLAQNKLTSLTLDNPQLTQLSCGFNSLTDLDITGCTALENFYPRPQIINGENIVCKVKVTTEQKELFSETWNDEIVPYMGGETPGEEDPNTDEVEMGNNPGYQQSL